MENINKKQIICEHCNNKGYYVTAKEYGNVKVACSFCNKLNERRLKGVRGSIFYI